MIPTFPSIIQYKGRVDSILYISGLCWYISVSPAVRKQSASRQRELSLKKLIKYLMSLKVKELIKQLKRFYMRAWFLVFSKHCARSVDYFNLTRKKLVLKRVFLNKERQLLIGSVVNTPKHFLA